MRVENTAQARPNAACSRGIPSFSHMVIVVVAASKLVHHPIGTQKRTQQPRVEAPLIWFCCSGSLNERD